MGFANVFTAFGVVLFGLMVSFVLFMIEIFVAKYGTGTCKKGMNVYNYRVKVESNPTPTITLK